MTAKERPDAFEWDPNKDAVNRAKHGISFDAASRVFTDPAVVILPTVRPQDREERSKATT
jgi:uncharacterized DUF497 family protein